MNGLPLAPLPIETGTEDIFNTDPLTILQQQFDQATKQVNFGFEQQRQNISRDSDNKLQMLNREYDIEYRALQERFSRLEDTKETAQRWQDAVTQLNTKYALAVNRTQGKIQPDLQDLEAAKQKQMQ